MDQFDTSFIYKDMLKAIVGAFGWLFSAWYMWAFILFMAALRIGPQLYENWRLGKAGMWEIDKMTGLEFEKYLEILFVRLGYHAERTRYAGDQGGDLILTKGGERILVQAKRYNKNVGNKAVQEAVAARPHYKCHRAVVVANREFTRAAQELAKSNQVELWGRHKLVEMVLSTQTAPPGPTQAVTPIAASRVVAQTVRPASPRSSVPTVPTCHLCGRPMVMRDSSRGNFWGCSGFPKCRSTTPVE